MQGSTIAAVATPQGVGGIGTVRISGPDAKRIADLCFRSVGGKTVDARVLHGDWQGSFMGPHMRAGYAAFNAFLLISRSFKQFSTAASSISSAFSKFSSFQ